MTVVIQYDTSHLNLKSEDLSSNTFVETKTNGVFDSFPNLFPPLIGFLDSSYFILYGCMKYQLLRF